MKKNIQITIELETWVKARENYNNLSKRIEELLIADMIGIKDIQKTDNIHEIKEMLKRKEGVVASLKAAVERTEKKLAEEKAINNKPIYNPDNHVTKYEGFE